jgi:hypothetical protein
MDDYDRFFSRYPAGVQAIGRKLRAMVKRAMPGAREVLVDRHNHIAYNASERPSSTVVYLCPLRDYVRLGFMFGTHLDDREHLLVGEGKRLRHIKVRSLAEAANPALRPLVAAAWTEGQRRLAAPTTAGQGRR